MPEPKWKPLAVWEAALAVLGPMPFFAPYHAAAPGRDVATILLGGREILRGAGPYIETWSVMDPGAAILAAPVQIGGDGGGTWALVWAIWQCLTAAYVYMVARRLFGRAAGPFAMLVYVTFTGGFGWPLMGRPENLAAWPLVAAIDAALRPGRRARFAAGLATGVATVLAWPSAAILLGIVAARSVDQSGSDGERSRWGGVELLGFALAWIPVVILGFAGGWLGTYWQAKTALAPRFLPEAAGVADLLRARAPSLIALTVPALTLPVLVAAILFGLFGERSRSRVAVTIAAVATSLSFVSMSVRAVGSVVGAAGLIALCAGFLFADACAWLDARLQRGRPGAKAALFALAAAATPLAQAAQNVTFYGAYVRGTDEVFYQGLFFDSATGFDSAVVIDVGRWIAGNTEPDDRVAAWADEPGLFWYADRRAVCGFTSILPAAAVRIDAAAVLDDCVDGQRPPVVVVQRSWRDWTAGTGLRSRSRVSVEAGFAMRLRRDYRLAQRLLGFDLYVLKGRPVVDVPLATIFQLNAKPRVGKGSGAGYSEAAASPAN